MNLDKKNKQTEIIIAGYGGQGLLFAGTLLSQTALEENKITTWFPAYGAEIRGGTANSSVIISNEEIGSPIIANPDILIALNEQSFKKFFPKAKDNALIIINSSLVKDIPKGKNIVSIPATEIADKELKDVRVANIVALGAYLKASNIMPLSSAKKACETVLADKSKMISLNQKALEIGFNYIK
jgi:2-oxoglutarate ferredoxin oxidoreductase subunit gamma